MMGLTFSLLSWMPLLSCMFQLLEKPLDGVFNIEGQLKVLVSRVEIHRVGKYGIEVGLHLLLHIVSLEYCVWIFHKRKCFMENVM